MIKKLNYILSRSQKIKIPILFVMILIGAFLELMGVSAILPLVDVILNPGVLESNGIYSSVAGYLGISSHQQFCMFLCIAMIVIYVLKNVYLSLMTYVQIRFSVNSKWHTMCRMFRAYMHQEYLFHTNHNVANFQRDICTDVESAYNTVLAFLQLMTELVTMALLGVFLFYIDITTAVSMLGMAGVVFLVVVKNMKKALSRLGRIERASAATKTKIFLQSFAGIKEIQIMDKIDLFCEQYEHFCEKTYLAIRKAQFLTRFPRYATETVIIVTMLTVVLIQLAVNTNISAFISVLSVYALAAIRLLPSMNRVVEYMNIISSQKAYIDGLYANMHIVKEYESRQKNDAVPDAMTFQKEIHIDDLSYKYPDAESMLFEHASLTIQKNESVAFIGGSGAGKTTLADIILGLLPANSGAVLVDGYDIHQNMQGWHHLIGYVPQVIYLMDDTIRSNVIFGISEDADSDDAVWKALEKAQLAEFVRSLPLGLDTIVGDRGVKLSGGQRQRIGVARALYSNPEVLILDEATSALDNDTEKAIMEAIDNLKGKTTLIIIAHRLSTIQNCDRIFEVQNKQIQERSKHDVLGH